MSSRKVEQRRDVVVYESASNISSRRQDQTWTPDNPIIFANSKDLSDREDLSTIPSNVVGPSLGSLYEHQSTNGSSQMRSKMSQHIWKPGQDIHFAGHQGQDHTGISIGSSRVPKREDESSRPTTADSFDYEPIIPCSAGEGSSQRQRPKKLTGYFPEPKQTSSFRPPRSNTSLETTLPLLPSVHVSSHPPPRSVKGFAHEKSTLSPKSTRTMMSSKPQRRLPLPGPFKLQSSDSDLGKSAAKPGLGPLKSQKLSATIPVAQSAETVREREEAKRRERERLERLKAEENQRLWEEPLRKKADKKFKCPLTKLEDVSQTLKTLSVAIEDSRRILKAIRQKHRKKLQMLRDEKRRTKADIEEIEQDIQHAESNIRTEARIGRWEKWQNRVLKMNLGFSKITKNASATPVGEISSDRKFYFKISKLFNRDPMELTCMNEEVQPLAHYWRKYFRLKSTLIHCPVAAANAQILTRQRTIHIAEQYEEAARQTSSHLLQAMREIESSGFTISSARRDTLQTTSFNMRENSHQITRLIERDLAALGSALFQSRNPSDARLNRWQRRTWRPFTIEVMRMSDLRGELWRTDYWFSAGNNQDVRTAGDIGKAQDSPLKPSLAAYTKTLQSLDYCRREFRYILESCIELSWARASADFAQGTLPPIAPLKPQLWVPGATDFDARTHNRTELFGCPSFQSKDLNEHESHIHFAHYRKPNGDKITLHLCTSVSSSERVAQRFLQDDVLGFDLEWRVNAPAGHSDNVCLLQLANSERIALFHLAVIQDRAFSAQRGQVLSHVSRIGPVLRSILKNRDILKVGVSIKADSTRLARFYSVDMAGLFELTHLYKQLMHKAGDKVPISKTLVRLTKQAEDYLGLPLAKGDERCSDWHRPLTQEQIIYAANDVYASYVLFKVMNQKRLGLNPTTPIPSPAEDNAPIPVPSPSVLGGLSTAANGSPTRGTAMPVTSSPDYSRLGLFKAGSVRSNDVPDLEESINVLIDGDPEQGRSSSSRRYVADVAMNWAAAWRKSAKSNEKITDQALQGYYLAQKLRWSLEDISLALRIPDMDSIAQLLLSLTKVTDLKLDEEFYRKCQLEAWVGKLLDPMTSEEKASLKPRERERHLSDMWCTSYPERHRDPLQAYCLHVKYNIPLGEVALSLEMNYRDVAKRILSSVLFLRQEITLFSLKKLAEHSQKVIVYRWVKDFVKSNLKIQRQRLKAGFDEDREAVRDIHVRRNRQMMKEALFVKPINHTAILMTSLRQVKEQVRPQQKAGAVKSKMPSTSSKKIRRVKSLSRSRALKPTRGRSSALIKGRSKNNVRTRASNDRTQKDESWKESRDSKVVLRRSSLPSNRQSAGSKTTANSSPRVPSSRNHHNGNASDLTSSGSTSSENSMGDSSRTWRRIQMRRVVRRVQSSSER